MKILVRLLILLMLLLFGATTALAQQNDTDGDGLPDSRDNCPTVPGLLENNGCPGRDTDPPPPTDSDGDGLPDPNDQCPTVAGVRENGGCPPVNNPPVEVPPNNPSDADGDGLPDPEDQCPTVAGVRENGGCPPNNPSDADGDGLPDPEDQCPTVAGLRENGGCPPFVPPALPVDGCYLTPNGDHRVFVRSQPDFEAEILGRITQGSVYEADGFLLIDSEMWFVLTNFPGGTGTPGYISGSVLNASAACDEIPQEIDSSINDLTAELCTVVTGFDASIWASDPAMPSVVYGTFVFAAAPGTSIPSGTQPIVVYNILHNLLQFNYLPENWTAFATDVGLMDVAYNADYAGDYNWPTPNGYLIHEDFMTPYVEFVEMKFYRLSGEFGGNCGPIVGSIDDLTQGSGTPVVALDIPPMPASEYACTITILTGTVFAFNYAPGALIPHDTAPIAILSNPDIYRPDASIWRATLYQPNPNTDYYEYLQYGVKDGNNVWMAAPRTGGTCGAIVSTNLDPQHTKSEPAVVHIYAVDPAMFGLLDGVKGNVSSINVHNIFDTLCGGEFAVIPGDPNGGGAFDVECRSTNIVKSIRFDVMDQLCGGEFAVIPADPNGGGAFDVECRPATSRQTINFDPIFTELCGGEFAVIPADPNGGGAFDVECRPAATIQSINFDVMDKLCGGEFAVIPADPNGGGAFDVECRPTGRTEVINFDPIFTELCGGEFAVIPADPNGGGAFDVECRPTDGTQSISFSNIFDTLCGGEFAVIPADPNGGGSFDVECRPARTVRAVNFDPIFTELCGGEFAVIPADPNGGGSYDVECRPVNGTQVINFDPIFTELCGGEFAVIPADPNGGGSYDLECRPANTSALLLPAIQASREAAGSQQPINFEVLDQLCGGEYQVWSETDGEGNPIFLNAECRAHAAPLGGGIDGLIDVNGNVHMNLQGRDAVVQTREDGVIVIDYCVDTTCTRVEIEASCAVTPTDEAEIYQIDCGEGDLMVIEISQSYIPGGQSFNNLKQLALP